MKKKMLVALACLICAGVFAAAVYYFTTNSNGGQELLPSVYDDGVIDGTYYGVLPCEDCNGIETFLYIFPDGKYEKSSKYLGESEYIFKEEGVWGVGIRRGYIVFGGYEGLRETWSIPSDGKIILLANGGIPVSGPPEKYTLQKQP